MMSYIAAFALAMLLLAIAGMGIVARVPRSVRNRKALSPSMGGTVTPADIVSQVISSGTHVTVTFAVPVTLNGMPGFLFDDGGVDFPVLAVVQTTATAVRFEFTTTVTIDRMIVPANDRAIRSRSGGYVPSGTFSVP
jgi:hypothetical protein